MRFVLATHNEKKRAEMQRILGSLGAEVVTQRELGVAVEAEEDGSTFMENARKKAQAVLEATGEAAIADDSGLCVDALGGAPGIFSARYGGDSCKSDAERVLLLLSNLKDVPDEKRTAKFVCAVCCLFPDGREISAQGSCPGVIAGAPRGENGFGYDPVFLLPELGLTMAELGSEKKNEISHRGQALRLFARKLDAMRRSEDLEEN